MKCPVCRGETEHRTVIRPIEVSGKIVILENVPADVCETCGEVLLAPDVAEKVHRVLRSNAQPKRQALVPVYDLDEVS